MGRCGKMNSLKKSCLLIVSISLIIFIVGCSPKEQVSLVAEVDLSSETKQVEAFGVVKAEETKDIIIDFPATVVDILVEEGQQLGYKEPIMTLDLSLYESEVWDMKNQLNIANLQYQSINKGLEAISLENGQVDKNKLANDLEYTKGLLGQTTEDYASMEVLYEAGAISKEELNQAKRALSEVQINMNNIEYQLESIEENLKQNNIKKTAEKDRLNIQTASINQIKKDLSNLEDRLHKPYIVDSQLVSEFENAVVYHITYGVGNIVNTTEKAFSISNLDTLIIESNVVEEFIGDVELGATVKIVPIAHRTREYEGRVIYISQMAFENNNETLVPIKISIDNMDGFLMPNYNVDIFIDAEI